MSKRKLCEKESPATVLAKRQNFTSDIYMENVATLNSMSEFFFYLSRQDLLNFILVCKYAKVYIKNHPRFHELLYQWRDTIHKAFNNLCKSRHKKHSETFDISAFVHNRFLLVLKIHGLIDVQIFERLNWIYPVEKNFRSVNTIMTAKHMHIHPRNWNRFLQDIILSPHVPTECLRCFFANVDYDKRAMACLVSNAMSANDEISLDKLSMYISVTKRTRSTTNVDSWVGEMVKVFDVVTLNEFTIERTKLVCKTVQSAFQVKKISWHGHLCTAKYELTTENGLFYYIAVNNCTNFVESEVLFELALEMIRNNAVPQFVNSLAKKDTARVVASFQAHSFFKCRVFRIISDQLVLPCYERFKTEPVKKWRLRRYDIQRFLPLLEDSFIDGASDEHFRLTCIELQALCLNALLPGSFAKTPKLSQMWMKKMIGRELDVRHVFHCFYPIDSEENVPLIDLQWDCIPPVDYCGVRIYFPYTTHRHERGLCKSKDCFQRGKR